MNYLVDYQRSRGLSADGICGKNTARAMMEDLGIESKKHFIHFISQVDHESMGFHAGEENLNYSPLTLKRIFGRYFNDVEIAMFARNGEKIANRVYANRLGNGDEQSGDGWKYKGIGSIQLTGKGNIQAYFKYKGLPVDTDPKVILRPEYYFDCGKYFFDENNIWQFCSELEYINVLTVSRAINLGNPYSHRMPNGYQARVQRTAKYQALIL